MKMIAPRLRHRVDIQNVTFTQDPVTGDMADGWATIRANDEPLIPAEIMLMSGREFVAAQAIQAGVNTKITIRWRDDVKPIMRVIHEGVTYNIKAVLPDPTLRRHITLMCEGGINLG